MTALSPHDSIWHISHLDLTLRMILSVVLGGLIGLEREWNNHAAGLRTHILVCLGANAIMLLSIYGFNEFVNEANVRVDPARLAAQVISGIGFLGAGAIMRTGATVSGLTTAASIWVVAAIGLSVGAGFYYVSVMTAILVLFCLFVLNHLEKHLLRKSRQGEFILSVSDKPGSLGEIVDKLAECKIQIKHLQLNRNKETPGSDSPSGVISLRIAFKAHNDEQLASGMIKIGDLPNVLAVEPFDQPVFLGKNKREHGGVSALPLR